MESCAAFYLLLLLFLSSNPRAPHSPLLLFRKKTVPVRMQAK